MEKNILQQIFDLLAHERDELREDLSDLSVNEKKIKVGDIGCGWGSITLCLMLELSQAECLGIDKFDPNDPPNLDLRFSFEIDNVRAVSNAIIENLKSESIHAQDSELLDAFQESVIRNGRFPKFHRGNIVTGEHLFPAFDQYFDLIYCKRVLFNLYNNGDGVDDLNKAIYHIANALKPKGVFCFVEVNTWGNSPSLEDSLRRVGFIFLPPRKIVRSFDSVLGNYQSEYLIYQCQKTDVE